LGVADTQGPGKGHFILKSPEPGDTIERAMWIGTQLDGVIGRECIAKRHSPLSGTGGEGFGGGEIDAASSCREWKVFIYYSEREGNGRGALYTSFCDEGEENWLADCGQKIWFIEGRKKMLSFFIAKNKGVVSLTKVTGIEGEFT